jgi:radical SAM protein with 4Fe4S-binding SPASM domain
MIVKTIYVEVTNQCNLNCRTCYNRSGLNRDRKEISVNQLEDIINLFLPYGLKRFLISGGEPTKHTEFNEILNLFDKHPELSFGVVTNGTNYNKKLIDYFNAHLNFTLQISLDGSCEEQNSKTRGTGHFDEVITFIHQLYNPNEKPRLKMVVSQNNYDDIENYYNLALSLDCTPEYAFIYKSGNGADLWDNKALSSQQKFKALKLIDKLNIEFETNAALPLCTTKCPFTDGLEDLSICIKVDGYIQPCQSLYESKYSIGNVFAFDPESFQVKMEHISVLAQERCNTDYGCKKCLLNGYCGKGCMAMAANLHDDPLADDGDCGFRKMQFLGYELCKQKVGVNGQR